MLLVQAAELATPQKCAGKVCGVLFIAVIITAVTSAMEHGQTVLCVLRDFATCGR